MVVKGYVIGKSSTYDNKYLVRIPFFESPGIDCGTDSIFSSTYECAVCYNPGTFEGYRENDCVFVAFENNRRSLPVIIGKLYVKGLEDEPAAYQHNVDMEVTNKAVLPQNTLIGEVTADDLLKALRKIEYLEDEIGKLKARLGEQ